MESKIKICAELLGFGTFSIVRYSREQKTRRFGNWICFRPQVKGGEDTYSVGALRKRTVTDPVSESSCFLFSRIPDDGKSPKTQ
jgi:hypothetical protein